jgi:glutathione synthase/RimK-type ligase-like ATP-grasp enzyme
MPTAFDWRIGVLARRPLFACKYYMARRHWQIIKRERDTLEEGGSEAVPLEAVPAAVLAAAVAAANLMGDGLYGVDLKEVDGKVVVIEVNDNPSIDGGFEDALLGDTLYREIMREFRKRLDAGRSSHG